jgi:endonuclease/exonuclease/phosphatase family metal-dependent hydrolase
MNCPGAFLRKVTIAATVIILTVLLLHLPAWAKAKSIKVMTRNQYLGADLTPIILAQTPGQFAAAVEAALMQVGQNLFPLRAQRLAKEVAITQPDVIGLQEVFDFKLDGLNVGPPFVDHLTETLEALADKGQKYVVAAISVNLNINIPNDIDGDGEPDQEITVLDRDVILVRKGIKFETLAGDFTAGGLCGVPIPNPVAGMGLPFPDTFVSTPSEDGCNYTVVAGVPVTPIGPIAIERGFVGVDAKVRGRWYRFVNTHLEVEELVPGDPTSAIFQSLQAVELVGTLQATTPSYRTLILVGDFNSEPDDMSIGSIIPPYQIIAGAGFVDIWDTNILRYYDPDGFTCCQLEDLSNTESLLDERIDHIFVRDNSFLPLAFVTGRVPIFPLWFTPNWASDHGGVFGKLFFQPKHQWQKNWKKKKRH